MPFSSQVGLSSSGSAAVSYQQQHHHHPNNNIRTENETSNPPLGPVTEHLPNSALNLAQAILVYDSNWRPGSAISKGSHQAAASATNHLPSNVPTAAAPAPKLKSRGYVAEGASSDHSASNRTSSRSEATSSKESETMMKARVSSASTSRSRPSTGIPSSTLPVVAARNTVSTGGSTGGPIDSLHDNNFQ